MSLRILHPGALTLIQDLGRPGWAGSGVTESGAADRHSLRLSNHFVGNAPGAPALETVLGGLHLLAEAEHTVALAGAPAPLTVVSGRERRAESGPVVQLAEGEELILGTAEWGMRTYLAVAGGLVATATMGSASTDTLSGLGPDALAGGDVLRVSGSGASGRRDSGWCGGLRPDDARADAESRSGSSGGGARSGARGRRGSVPGLGPVATLDPGAEGWHGQPYMLDVLPGPRTDWFTPEAVVTLLSTPFEVTGIGDRVGVRLAGAALARSQDGELLSEPMVRGAVQVPADGSPLIFGPDHPVTGGYPVIGVLTEAAADASGQLRPGQQIRFRPRGAWPVV